MARAPRGARVVEDLHQGCWAGGGVREWSCQGEPEGQEGGGGGGGAGEVEEGAERGGEGGWHFFLEWEGRFGEECSGLRRGDLGFGLRMSCVLVSAFLFRLGFSGS